MEGIPKKTFTPLGEYVSLHVHKVDQTKGGVVLPQGVGDPSNSPTATVIAVGPDCKWVKEGDVVVCHMDTAARNVIHQGHKVVVCKESQLIGVSIKVEDD